jgi:hypothetical protein
MPQPQMANAVTGESLRTAQENLERIQRVIAPYSVRPKRQDDPPMRWISGDHGTETLHQTDL